MRKMTFALLLLAGAAVPVAAATTFADALGPALMSMSAQQQNMPASAPANAPANANDPTPAAMPADPTYHGEPYVGALTAPPADAMNKNYPVCSAQVSDNCRNADGN